MFPNAIPSFLICLLKFVLVAAIFQMDFHSKITKCPVVFVSTSFREATSIACQVAALKMARFVKILEIR